VHYRSGDNYVICDRCGFKKHASEVSKDWDGLIVCREDHDGRHPQDFVRGRPDHQVAAISRPDPPDVFLSDVSGTPVGLLLIITTSDDRDLG
jgi:hypothetical protein